MTDEYDESQPVEPDQDQAEPIPPPARPKRQRARSTDITEEESRQRKNRRTAPPQAEDVLPRRKSAHRQNKSANHHNQPSLDVKAPNTPRQLHRDTSRPASL